MSPTVHSEQGSALAVTLVIVGVWSFVILALVAFAEVGFGTATSSADLSARVYASEAGAELALTRLATDRDRDCGELPLELELNTEQLDGETVQVDCDRFPIARPEDLIAAGLETRWLVDIEVRIGADGADFEDGRLTLRARALLDDFGPPDAMDITITNWTVLR